MSQINTRKIVLLNSTVTTSGTGPDINAIMAWQSAIVSVVAATTSGTLPTFDVYLQKKIPQAAAADTPGNMPTGTGIYDDLLHFTQVTTNSTRLSQLCTGPQSPTANATLVTTADWAQQDAAIAAGDIRIGPIGGVWRVKYVVGGTTPSSFLSVCVELIPFST